MRAQHYLAMIQLSGLTVPQHQQEPAPTKDRSTASKRRQRTGVIKSPPNTHITLTHSCLSFVNPPPHTPLFQHNTVPLIVFHFTAAQPPVQQHSCGPAAAAAAVCEL
ncbi:hypothetical protein PLESTM_001092900 [Pleodorina starrii]|nr:hypothetical protein PLESTM_001092900 [Pleodorina starrii]